MADPGEGPGGGRPSLFLDQTEARRFEKKFGRPPPHPLYLRVWETGPPSSLNLRSGSGTSQTTINVAKHDRIQLKITLKFNMS